MNQFFMMLTLWLALTNLGLAQSKRLLIHIPIEAERIKLLPKWKAAILATDRWGQSRVFPAKITPGMPIIGKISAPELREQKIELSATQDISGWSISPNDYFSTIEWRVYRPDAQKTMREMFKLGEKGVAYSGIAHKHAVPKNGDLIINAPSDKCRDYELCAPIVPRFSLRESQRLAQCLNETTKNLDKGLSKDQCQIWKKPDEKEACLALGKIGKEIGEGKNLDEQREKVTAYIKSLSSDKSKWDVLARCQRIGKYLFSAVEHSSLEIFEFKDAH